MDKAWIKICSIRYGIYDNDAMNNVTSLQVEIC